MNDKLYAWADQTNLGIGEHTWVSDYQPATGEPDPAKGSYWYCWGDAHPEASRLGIGEGGIDFAQRLAAPNNKTADCGIEYITDGVCHQMANRLLRFSLDDSNQPLTVKGAKGYQASKGMYGEYGEKVSMFTPEAKKQRIKNWVDTVSEYEKLSHR